MPPFLDHTFTHSDGTLITAATPGTGSGYSNASYTVHTAEVRSGRLTAGNADGSSAVAFNDTVPPTADYFVQATFRALAVDQGYAAIGLRCDPATGDGYWLRREGGYWMMVVRVGGSETWFGGGPGATSVDTDYVVKVEAVGTTFKVYIDGVLFSENTDSSISGAGRIGLWLNYSDASNGWHLDNLTAEQIGSGGGGSPPGVPTGVSASDGVSTSQINVTWTPGSGATSHDVQVSTDNVSFSAAPSGTGLVTNSYNHTGLAAGVTRYYRVRANNADGSSAYSSSDQGSTSSGSSANAITMGALTLTRTYRSIGFVWPFTGDDNRNSSMVVWFKKVGDASYTRRALPPDRHPSSVATTMSYRAFHGSVLFNDPGDQYTLRFIVTDPDGVTASATVTTTLNDAAHGDSTRTATTSTTATVETAAIAMRDESGIATNAARRAAAAYFIRSDGNNSNAGTSNTNSGAWATLEKAVQMVNAGSIPEHSIVMLQAGRTFAAPQTALTKGICFVGAVDPNDGTGTKQRQASIVNIGSHTNVEDGPVSTTNQVYGTAPTGATPDTNYTAAQVAPWVLDTTTGRNLWRYDTTLGGAVTGIAPNQLGFVGHVGGVAVKDGIPQRVPWWDAKSGSVGTTTLQGFSDLVWNSTNTYRQNYGFWHGGGTTVYARFPGDINPNNYYTVIGTNNGFNLNNGANDVELRALVLRGFHSCIRRGTNGHVWYRLLTDHCNFHQFWAGIFYDGVAPSTYGADDTHQYFYAGDSHQWIERSGPYSVSDNQNLYAISRTFIKGTLDGMSGDRVGADGSENQFIYWGGGAKRVTARWGTLNQVFNGFTVYQPGSFDMWHASDFDAHDLYCAGITDEVFEPEFGVTNWRAWNCHMHQGFNFYSMTPVDYGPFYIINCSAYDQGLHGINNNGFTETCMFIKFGKSASFDRSPRVYALHNTMITRRGRPGDTSSNGALSQPQFAQRTNSGGETEPRWYLRGNLVVVGRYLIDYLVAGPDDILSENYNFWATYDTSRGIKVWVGSSDTNHVSITNYRTATGEGANSNNNGSANYDLAGTPTVDYILSQLVAPTTTTGDLRLVGGSALATRVPPEDNVRDVVYPGSGAWQPYHRADATMAALGYAEPGSADTPAADSTPPTFNNANVPTTGNTVVLNLTEAGSPPVLPSGSPTGFTVKVAGVTKTVSSVTRTGSTQYTFTLAAPVVYSGQAVTIEYAPGNVTDSATAPNSMGAFGAQTVTNNSTQTPPVTDSTPPAFANANVPVAGTSLIVNLTEATSPPVLPTSASGFAVLVGGLGRPVLSATRTGNTQYTLSLASAVYAGETVTVSYSPGNVTDSASPPNSMGAFTNQAVTNNSTQIAPEEPPPPVVTPPEPVAQACATFTLRESLQYVRPDGARFYLHSPPTRVVTQEEGFGTPPIEYVSDRAPFQHGVTLRSYHLGTRSMQLVVMQNFSSRAAYRNGRAEFLNLLRPNRVTDFNNMGKLLYRLANGTKRQIDVMLEAGPGFQPPQQGWRAWTITEVIRFMAPDPAWYDPQQYSVVFSASVAEVQELVFPATFPITFESFGGSAGVTYEGTWLDYPTIVLNGPITGPQITNQTTGDKIALDYTIADGETVTINLRNIKTVTNGAGVNLLNKVTSDSDLATFAIEPDPVAPGGVNIISAAGSGTGLASTVAVHYYNRYIGI